MKKLLPFLVICAFIATGAMAQHIGELNPQHGQFHVKGFARPGGGGTSNLSYHNGPVIHQAKIVAIFWGSAWQSDSATINTMMNFISQFGTSSHYSTITQYSDTTGNIQTTNLGNVYWNDTTNPGSTNVTDAMMQQEVTKYISSHGGTADASTIYEVFIPNGYYSSSGSSTSCGGTNLQYCAYHSNFNYNGVNVKYSSQPYPSCGGCQASGFSLVQDMTMFVGHETREAVTDEDGNAWYDRRGYEADDKCAWTNLFTDGGFGYQPEWSNKVSGCVQ